MTLESDLFHLALAALNATLGLVLLAAGKRAILAALLLANAAYAGLAPFSATEPIRDTLDAITIALLFALAAAWVRPAWLSRAMMAVAALTVAVRALAAFDLIDASAELSRAIPLRVAILTGLLVFARPDAESRYFLAAFLLSATTFLPLPGNPILLGRPTDVVLVALWALLVAIWAAVLWHTIAAVVRLARRGPEEASFAVALAAPVGATLVAAGLFPLIYLLLRPLLFGYGILHGRLHTGGPIPRPLTLAALGTAILASFAAPALAAADRGAGAVASVALGVVGLVAVSFLFARPIANTLLAGRSGAGAELAEGALIEGRYLVDRKLGEGGSGAAWLARDTRGAREVVLKAARSGAPEEAAALEREAKALARLDHPSIVRILDVHRAGRTVILVLERVEGAPAAGPLPSAAAARVAADLLAALEHAHARGIVHGDVKPANVLLTPEGHARLMDFGLARREDETVSSWKPGPAAGTPAYMSPEQVRGLPLDAKSDLYSLGVVLYELVTGERYHERRAENDFDLRRAVIEDARDLPVGAWRPLLAALLQKEAAKRPNAAEARALLP